MYTMTQHKACVHATMRLYKAPNTLPAIARVSAITENFSELSLPSRGAQGLRGREVPKPNKQQAQNLYIQFYSLC